MKAMICGRRVGKTTELIKSLRAGEDSLIVCPTLAMAEGIMGTLASTLAESNINFMLLRKSALIIETNDYKIVFTSLEKYMNSIYHGNPYKYYSKYFDELPMAMDLLFGNVKHFNGTI